MAWTIDTVHSHVGFSVRHMMVSTVRGQFRKFGGTVEIDPKDFTRSSFEGEVDIASIDTGNPDRDNHLRTGDFFDAPGHPKLVFKSTRIESKGDGEFRVHGDITIRGVTKPLTLEVEFHGTSKDPYGRNLAGVTARGSVNRKDFGVSWNKALEAGGFAVADKVNLELELEAVYAEDKAQTAASATA
jgi:polyisoprenoid-binding protein YceI